MTWAAIFTVAAGAYLFKLLGVTIGARREQKQALDHVDISHDRLFDRLGQLIPPAVLLGLIVTQTVSTDGALAADARLIGVAVGAVAAWRRAPFWVVLVISAGAAAAVRSFAGIA